MKDNVYIGKAGNKYLKGKTLVKSASSADVFESETGSPLPSAPAFGLFG